MDKNIIAAIEAEKEYLNNIGELSLLERVMDYGYDNLNDYFYDKVKYQIVNEQLTIKAYHMEDGVSLVFKALNNGESGAFTVRENEPRTWIWAGRDNIYLDTNKANELGYGICNFEYSGGPIITTNDDFSLALVVPNKIDLDIKLLIDYLIKYLIKRGYQVTQDNNDLIVNNKKVLGSTYYKNDKATLIAFQISLTDHSDIINQLSLKESIKEPGYLTDITRDEIEEVINIWLHTI